MNFSAEAFFILNELVAERIVGRGKDLNREKTRVLCAVEGYSSYGNATRHLENREYRIPAIDRIRRLYWHADNG